MFCLLSHTNFISCLQAGRITFLGFVHRHLSQDQVTTRSVYCSSVYDLYDGESISRHCHGTTMIVEVGWFWCSISVPWYSLEEEVSVLIQPHCTCAVEWCSIFCQVTLCILRRVLVRLLAHLLLQSHWTQWSLKRCKFYAEVVSVKSLLLESRRWYMKTCCLDTDMSVKRSLSERGRGFVKRFSLNMEAVSMKRLFSERGGDLWGGVVSLQC